MTLPNSKIISLLFKQALWKQGINYSTTFQVKPIMM